VVHKALVAVRKVPGEIEKVQNVPVVKVVHKAHEGEEVVLVVHGVEVLVHYVQVVEEVVHRVQKVAEENVHVVPEVEKVRTALGVMEVVHKVQEGVEAVHTTLGVVVHKAQKEAVHMVHGVEEAVHTN